MIDQDGKVKLLNASTRRCDEKNHLQEDDSFPLDLKRDFTLHGALQLMIVDDEKGKLPDALAKGFEESNHLQAYSSFPFDLSQGNILHQALQIMKTAMKK